MDLDVRRLVIDPGTVPGPNRPHPRAETSFVILAGELEVRIGSERYPLAEGDAIFVPPGVAYATHNEGDGPCVALVIHDVPCEDDPCHAGFDQASAPPTSAIDRQA